eukprot:PRCOL_00003677-RA
MSRAPIAGSETDGPPSLFETSLAVLCRAVWAGDLRDLSERPLPEEALMRMFKMTLEAGKLDERVLSTFASADPGLMAMLIERLGIRTTLPPILPSHCR